MIPRLPRPLSNGGVHYCLKTCYAVEVIRFPPGGTVIFYHFGIYPLVDEKQVLAPGLITSDQWFSFTTGNDRQYELIQLCHYNLLSEVTLCVIVF